MLPHGKGERRSCVKASKRCGSSSGAYPIGPRSRLTGDHVPGLRIRKSARRSCGSTGSRRDIREDFRPPRGRESGSSFSARTSMPATTMGGAAHTGGASPHRSCRAAQAYVGRLDRESSEGSLRAPRRSASPRIRSRRGCPHSPRGRIPPRHQRSSVARHQACWTRHDERHSPCASAVSPGSTGQ